jgi:hypothetical protein
MSIEQFMRACGTVASLYMVGFAISAMTMASIGAVGLSAQTLCTGRDCGRLEVSANPHPMPAGVAPSPYHAVLIAPLLLLDR